MRYSLNTYRRRGALSDWPSMSLTFVACLSCWVTGYIYSVGFPIDEGNVVLPLWSALCNALSNRVVVYIFGLLLFLLVAYVMQRISDIEMFIHERTRLPFMIFILLISTNVGLIPAGATTIALLCFVSIIYQLFNSYQQPESTGAIFNAGVMAGVACLFIPQALWFVPLLWIGMYKFRSINLRSLLASLVGFLIIYWFVLAWCIWKHDFSMFTSLFSTLLDFSVLYVDVHYYHIGSVGVVLLLIMAFFHVKMDSFNNSVRVRQMFSFLLNMSVWSLFLILLYGRHSDFFLAIMYLSSSVLIAYFFENINYRIRFLLYYSMLALWVVSFIMRVWNI